MRALRIIRWFGERLSSKAPQPIADSERLARFLVRSDWIREDKTIRHNAFMPRRAPDLDLSVTRHGYLSEQQLWSVGKEIAEGSKNPLTLYGRADLDVCALGKHPLKVVPDPIPRNPNHANILGWPEEKSAQKSIAQQLAEASAYKPLS